MSHTAGWRERWAAQETARQRAQHETALAMWAADQHRLRWYADLARTAQPLANNGLTEIRLRKGEEILWQTSNVRMVEVPDTIQLFGPVHSVYSPTQRSGGYLHLFPHAGSVRDQGHVVVTNQRVFFDGAKNRDWMFSDLSGVGHGSSTPMTLMRVDNRQRLSGFLFDPDTAAAFQFYLALGIAEFRGDRSGFESHLAGLLSFQTTQRPVPPPPVDPRLAPNPVRRAIFGPRGATPIRQLTPILVASMLAFCVGVSLVGGNLPATPSSSSQQQSQTRQDQVVPVTTTAANVPAAVAPSPSPSPSPSAAIVVPPPPPPTTTTKAPTTKPPAEDTCGAPQNPWGYDFCPGGSTITNPPSGFCGVFECIPSFWQNTNGYVIECEDHMFSHSGGRSGSCSHHGGNARTLTT